MQKLNWQEAKDYLYNYNKEHNITSKGSGEESAHIIIVITEDSFDQQYSLDARSYRISSDNKAFIAGMGGYSIYGSSLDGSDRNVRLERYLEEEGNPKGWKIDYCYIEN